MDRTQTPIVSQFSGQHLEGKYITVGGTIYNRREALALSEWLLLPKEDRFKLSEALLRNASKLPQPCVD